MQFEELNPQAMPQGKVGNVINPAKPFEPIQFAHSPLRLGEGCYRVYSSATEFKEVKAGSAYEAMQKSEIRSPFKIMRFSIGQMKVLSRQVMSQNEAAEESLEAAIEEGALEPKSAEEISAATEAKEVPEPTEEKAVNEGLVGEEVDVLLKDATPVEDE